uniref:Death domain-containing protein n=1 Tax=Biomphalaria glabrata TaxID=6526 RepID=A0A2C9L9E6_BIOGL
MAKNRPSKKLEGVETRVRVMAEQTVVTHTLSETLTARQLKRMLPLNDMKSLEVIAVYHDSRFESINDEDEIGDRIVTCKELLILPKGEMKSVDFSYYESFETSKNEPYTWFYNLPKEQRERPVISEDVAFLGYCLGNDWRNIILSIGLGFGEIEIAEADYKSANGDAVHVPTQLLMRWIQRNGSKATFATLIDKFKLFEKVNPGFINWDDIKTIFTRNQKEEMSRTSND